MTTFSFHPVKTITTGEGGAVLTNDETLARRCRRFRSHGIVRSPEDFVQQPAGLDGTPIAQSAEVSPWYYEMQELGFNYRITDFQCALGEVQLSRLESFIRRRAEIVLRYDDSFMSLATGKLSPHATSGLDLDRLNYSPEDIAWHLYVLQLDFVRLRKTRSRAMAELRSKGIGSQVHYIPVHLQPYYRRKYGYSPGKCPVAEAYYARALSLALYPAMTDTEIERVITAVLEISK